MWYIIASSSLVCFTLPPRSLAAFVFLNDCQPLRFTLFFNQNRLTPSRIRRLCNNLGFLQKLLVISLLFFGVYGHFPWLCLIPFASVNELVY